MDLPVSFYVASTVAILITGISKSGFGGGLGVMAVPLMSMFVAPQFAAAVLMPILLAMDVLVVLQYRKAWSRKIVLRLLPGAAMGLGLGAVLFQSLDANVIRFVIGCLAVVFVVQFVLQRRQSSTPRAPSALTTWVLGGVSGFASYVAHAGGPPVKGVLLRQNLNKTEFVGTNTMYFFALNSVKTLAYGFTGTMSQDTIMISLWLAPVLVVGVVAGRWLHHRVEPALFVNIVYGCLALTALRLLTDSAARMWFAVV